MKEKLQLMRLRSEFTRLVRAFFEERNYLEVETPLLSPWLIPEPSIEVFQTRFIDPYGKNYEAYLVPSPELWMKRLISMGAGNIFQISKAFRNMESLGKIHNPEFTMLEWYTVESEYRREMEVTEGLLTYLGQKLSVPPAIDLTPPFPRLSMKEAFRRQLNWDLDGLLEKEALFQAATELGLLCGPTESWEELFNKVFLTYVEPELPAERPLFLYGYPAALTTLAKQGEDPAYRERWELYIRGVEVANCFSEETDQAKVAAIIREEGQRKATSQLPHRIDEEFADYFHDNYPPCSGVAVGMDRFFMTIFKIDSLEGVIFFPFSGIFNKL